MIRREDLGRAPISGQDTGAVMVRGGEPVRISGLGTLTRVRPRTTDLGGLEGCPECKGTGEIECLDCGGLGCIDSEENDTDTEECGECDEQQTIECECPKAWGYRLTLTAAVAKDEVATFARDGALAPALDRDVRHLARAIGAPVEVWSPEPATLITTVHP